MKFIRSLNKKKSLFLIAIICIVAFLSTGCISGIYPIGWSGVTIVDDSLYTGSREGMLVSVNITDGSRLKSESLKAKPSTGLLGCNPSYGGSGCGGGSQVVAIYSTPAVYGGSVYLAGYNGKVYAYNRTNLAVRWVFPEEGYCEPFVAGPVVDDGRIFIGDSSGTFYALDAETGEEIWSFIEEDKSKRERIWGTAAVVDSTVYFGSFNKTLYALNANDGSVKWRFNADGALIATPLVVDGVVYAGDFSKKIYALDADTGTKLWEFTGDSWFWAQPVLVNDVLYAADMSGKVYLLDCSDGSKQIEHQLEEGVGVAANPVVSDAHVIIANREGTIYSISKTTGELKLLANLDSSVNGPISVYEGIIYLQTDKYEIARIDANNGTILEPFLLAG